MGHVRGDHEALRLGGAADQEAAPDASRHLRVGCVRQVCEDLRAAAGKHMPLLGKQDFPAELDAGQQCAARHRHRQLRQRRAGDQAAAFVGCQVDLLVSPSVSVGGQADGRVRPAGRATEQCPENQMDAKPRDGARQRVDRPGRRGRPSRFRPDSSSSYPVSDASGKTTRSPAWQASRRNEMIRSLLTSTSQATGSCPMTTGNSIRATPSAGSALCPAEHSQAERRRRKRPKPAILLW